ncbi:ubiquitin related modifier 1 [Nematocida minor]|uniref:ubiquitin related modifier 1 n=1 Tax=Nematocida minor TaxID=1912983 RepID=UPI0022205CEB|nr:ubiquitin related modifier 1 [Nematocida minor]KAI5192592.1 ubiquitin related modifier 1 [Nematocida minor]
MKILFRGGLEDKVNSETLLLNISEIKNSIYPTVENVEIVAKDLIHYIELKHIRKGYKHFSTEGELEGGILCMIDNVDWELLKEHQTPLKNNYTIRFITTMHGG